MLKITSKVIKRKLNYHTMKLLNRYKYISKILKIELNIYMFMPNR